MIINQGLQEGLISSAPRSVTQPHQYISLSSPLQYIYQYINTKEEAIHDVASFLCTRSAIACNNQIRCYTFFWARGGQKQMTACYHDCMIVFEFCYIYICINKSQVPNLFPYCINNLWQLMTRAVLMKVSRKVLLWGADPLFT